MACTTCSKSSGWKHNSLFPPTKKLIAAVLISLFFSTSLFAAPEAVVVKSASSRKSIPAVVPPVTSNEFAKQFYMRPDQKLLFKTTEINGFIFVTTPNRNRRAQYSLVTDFDRAAMRSRYITGPENLEALRQWVKASLKKTKHQGVEIKRLQMPEGGGAVYSVGHKIFNSEKDAKAQIEQSRAVIEAQGGDFEAQAQEAEKLYMPPPEEVVTAQQKAQFQKEEELVLRYLDHMDVGNEIFGPLQGTPVGEKILWQSFAETTWRNTNLEDERYMQQVAFWTNRIVMKGIKAPFNTIDPYVEATVSLDSTGIDFKNNVILALGAEWRPFARNAWLVNTRFWSLPLLTFVRNYRVYIEYQDRKNLYDEIIGGKGHDWKAGVGIFYEWGIDLPPVSEGDPSTIPDFIRRYIWGEYFGNYYFTHTNFNAEDDVNAFIYNSSIILGVKLPGIPLPANPINDKLVLMPYMRFEHVSNTEFSFPFENRFFAAAGMRWMPFNSYRYKDNEWLAKTKIFFEYVGVGKVHHWKQNGDEVQGPGYDFRVGVNISSKRI